MYQFYRKDGFNLGFDRINGVIKSIKHPDFPLEFAANEKNTPHIDVSDSRWLGDLILSIKKAGNISRHATSLSGKYRNIDFTENVNVVYKFLTDQNQNHIDVELLQNFKVNENILNWNITIKNNEKGNIEIGEFGIPFPVNNFYKGLPQNQLYEKRVISHLFPSGHGSFILTQGLKGETPLLLIIPEGDTYLEAAAHETKNPFNGMGLKWEGIKTGYIYSKFLLKSGNWKNWFNDHTSLVLRPGDKKEFKFKFTWLKSRNELQNKLYELGKVSVKVHPGMVIPKNMDIFLKFDCRRGINNLEFEDEAGSVVVKDGFYKLKYNSTGEKRIKVSFDKDKWARIIFFVTENIGSQIRKRAHFIVNNQQYRNKNDGRYGAFLMWDAEKKSLVTAARHAYLVGGSDELGFADPLFLAYKNTFYPVKKEIRALELYIDRFILGKLQKPDDFGVKLWYVDEEPDRTKGSRTIRSYNYTHLFNIYYYLYRISKLYELTKIRRGLEYLKLAFNTAKAFYTLPMASNADPVKYGNMGASNILNILCALQEEGLSEEYTFLKNKILESAEYFEKTLYPFESEYNYDTTGHETVYYFREFIGKEKLNKKVVNIIMANRGIQPFWFWYAGDTRWGCGNARYNEYEDEVCFSYMTSLNALVLLKEYEKSGKSELLHTGFAALLSNWAAVNKNGEGFYLYDWEPRAKRFDPWSSEMGMGIWGSLRGLKSYFRHDPDFGLIGYGCRVIERTEKIIVYPLGGFNTSIYNFSGKSNIKVEKGYLHKVIYSRIDDKIDLSLRKLSAEQKNVFIYTSFLPKVSKVPGYSEYKIVKRDGEFKIILSFPGRTIDLELCLG